MSFTAHEFNAAPLHLPAAKRMTTLPACERAVDVSDVWVEECDPENVDGYLATAHFDIVDDFAELIALEVESTIYTRQGALETIGYEALCRIEALETETIHNP